MWSQMIVFAQNNFEQLYICHMDLPQSKTHGSFFLARRRSHSVSVLCARWTARVVGNTEIVNMENSTIIDSCVFSPGIEWFNDWNCFWWLVEPKKFRDFSWNICLLCFVEQQSSGNWHLDIFCGSTKFWLCIGHFFMDLQNFDYVLAIFLWIHKILMK